MKAKHSRVALVHPAVAGVVLRYCRSSRIRTRVLAGGWAAILLPRGLAAQFTLQERLHRRAGGACLTWPQGQRAARIAPCPCGAAFEGGCLEVSYGGPGGRHDFDDLGA